MKTHKQNQLKSFKFTETLSCISFVVRLNKITLSLDFSHRANSYQVGFELRTLGKSSTHSPHLPQPLD